MSNTSLIFVNQQTGAEIELARKDWDMLIITIRAAGELLATIRLRGMESDAVLMWMKQQETVKAS